MTDLYVQIVNTPADQWLYKGELEDLLSTHLIELLKEHGITTDAWSESHAIAILATHGVHVHLVDHFGQPLEY